MVYWALQSSFNGGELSRRLQSRSDLSIYAIGTSQIENMACTVEGSLVKRSGTRWRGAALAGTSWLSSFIFNATQAYLIAWSQGALRFYTNDALLMSGGSPVQVAVPYTAAQAPRVSTQQSFDVLYMAHGSHPPAALSRTGAAAFSYAALDLKGGPFDDRNEDDSITVTASAASGTGVTITASDPIFVAGHVGSRFRIEAQDFGNVRAWQNALDGVVIGDLRRSEGRVYKALTAGRTGNVQPIHTIGAEWDGDDVGKDINDEGPYGVKWEYLHDRFGVVKITAVASDGLSCTATVERRLPESVLTVATSRWAHSLFSAAAGWPQLVILWRGRLWFFKDFDLCGSVSADYRNFSEFDENGEASPDMAIRKRLDIADRVLWVRSDRQSMVIGTSLGEYVIGPRNPAEPVTAGNLDIVPQSAHGSAEVWALKTASEVIFMQRGGRKVRAGAYEFGQDRYLATNLTLWARQVTQSGVVQMAYQGEPEELLWVLRADGQCAAHPYNPAQDVKGWSRALIMPGAAVKSICAIPSPDGARDDLWLLVERDGVRSIEQLERWWDEDAGLNRQDAYFVDSGITYSGAATNTISGLGHLVGKTVAILANGAELPRQVVAAGGTITLPRAYTKVHVGLPYTARVTLLRPEIPMRDGTSQGRLRRIISLLGSLIDSFGLRAGTTDSQFLDEIFGRDPATPMDVAPPLFSGWTDDRSIGGGMDRNTRGTFEHSSPNPWILAAIVQKVETGEK